jgi:hypothetical protein
MGIAEAEVESCPRVGLRELREPEKVARKLSRMDVNVHAQGETPLKGT